MFYALLKPRKLLHLTETLLPWIKGIGLVAFVLGLIGALFIAPADYQQGDAARIMYVHVPASWGGLGIYTVMALLSGIAFLTRIPLLHLIVKAMAPVGACFTFISLATGAIWGMPTWGTWWVWDARLTSMLLLFFLYLGYLQLIRLSEPEEKGLAAGAILLMVGWINVPIIKWSVDWWTTLHQPASLMRFAKPAMPFSMMWPLVMMALAFAAYAFYITHLRLQQDMMGRLRERP